MPTAPAVVAERHVVDTRRVLLVLEHPLIGTEWAGPDRKPHRFTIEKVMIYAVRDVEDGPGWGIGIVETRGLHLLSDGGQSGVGANREYHPDGDRTHRYHHSDMPSALATLVHNEVESWSVKPTLTVRWDHDEQITISLPGHPDLIIANHDRHGWDGMQAAIDVATAMAQALGLPVVTEGTPNL